MKVILKRTATIFLSLAVLLSFTPVMSGVTGGAAGAQEVYADTETYEYEGFTVTYSNGVLTFSGTGDIPRVELYSAPWESRKNDVTKIVVEEGITGLGDYALYGFRNVKEISLPASLTTIPAGWAARGFYMMAPLETITVPEASASFRVVDNVLYSKDMSRLVVYPRGKTDTDFVIPDGVQAVDLYAVRSNPNLKTITIPASVTTAGDAAFSNLSNLEEFIVAEGSTAFAAQDGVLFNKDMTRLIAYPAMRTGSYTIPDTVTTLTASCFAYSHLTSIDLNNVAGTIPNYAFNYATITSVTIPEGVTSIGQDAFRATGLTEVVLPGSVASVGTQAFADNEGLKATVLNKDCAFTGTGVFGQTGIVYGLDGSTAQERYGSQFRAIDKGKDLYYNGQEQNAFDEAPGIVYSGTTSATEPGSYEAAVAPAEGYQWADGTTTPIPVTWTIKTPAVSLSKTAFTYNGKIQKPTVTVKDGSKKLVSGKDYTVTNSGRKTVGKGTVKVTLKGNYTGSKTVTYKINPKGATIKTPASAKKALTAKWTKQSAKMSTSYISGYQVQVATNSKFTTGKKTVNVAGYSKTSKKVTGLKGGKKYYVHVRTYKTVSGVKYYSPWSKTKTVTTKK